MQRFVQTLCMEWWEWNDVVKHRRAGLTWWRGRGYECCRIRTHSFGLNDVEFDCCFVTHGGSMKMFVWKIEKGKKKQKNSQSTRVIWRPTTEFSSTQWWLMAVAAVAAAAAAAAASWPECFSYTTHDRMQKWGSNRMVPANGWLQNGGALLIKSLGLLNQRMGRGDRCVCLPRWLCRSRAGGLFTYLN